MCGCWESAGPVQYWAGRTALGADVLLPPVPQLLPWESRLCMGVERGVFLGHEEGMLGSDFVSRSF